MYIDSNEFDCFHFDLIDEIEILRYELHEKYLEVFKTALFSSENSLIATFLNLLNTPVSFDMNKATKEYLKMQKLVHDIDKRLDNIHYTLTNFSTQQIA